MAEDGRIYISKDVIFDELNFPFSRLFGEPASVSSTTAAASSSQQTLTVLSAPPTRVTPPSLDNPTPAEQVDNDSSPAISTSVGANSVLDNDSRPGQAPAPTPAVLVQPDNTHPMYTRAKAGVVKPKLQHTLRLAHAEPRSTKSALSNPTWLAATKTEYEAIM